MEKQKFYIDHLVKERRADRPVDFSDERYNFQEADRNEHEQQALLRSLTGTIRTLLQDERFEVLTSNSEIAQQLRRAGRDPEKDWLRVTESDPVSGQVKREFIFIPDHGLHAEPEVVTIGSAAHEAGHSMSTRHELYRNDPIMKAVGFSGLLQAAEERPTDHVIRANYEELGERVDQMRFYLAQDSEERRQEVITRPGVDPARLARHPKFQQLCNMIVAEPHIPVSMFAEYFDEDVIEAYESIRDVVEAYEGHVPGIFDSEARRGEIAEERFEMLKTDIWPVVKSFVKKDTQQEALNQMIKDHVNEQVKKLMEEKGLGEEFKQLVEDIASGEPMMFVPIPAALQQALQQAFDALPKAKKEELRKKALQVMKNIDDALLKQYAAQLQERPETHAERDIKVAKEMKGKQHKRKKKKTPQQQPKQPPQPPRDRPQQQERNEGGGKFQKDIAEVELKSKEWKEGKRRYDEVKIQVTAVVDGLYHVFDDLFSPTSAGGMRVTDVGYQVHLPSVFNRTGQKRSGSRFVDNRIFTQQEQLFARDYAIGILLDLSGSMVGSSFSSETGCWDGPPLIADAHAATIALANALERAELQHFVIGFGTDPWNRGRYDMITHTDGSNISEVQLYKGLSERISIDDEAALGAMVDQAGGGTPLFEGLLKANFQMDQTSAPKKFVLVLTDGSPNSPLACEKKINKMILDGTIPIGIGLGGGTEFVEELFPIGIGNVKMNELPQRLGDMLGDVIRNPQMYEAKAHQFEQQHQQNGMRVDDDDWM